MFDDPNKELKRLENQLLKAEMTDEEFEAFYDELYDEFGPGKREEEDYLKDSPVNNVRGSAAGTSQNSQPRKSAPKQPAPRQYQTGGPAPYGGSLDEDRYAAPPRKEKGIRGLVICACAECLGIVAVVLWWMLKIL